VAFLSILWCPDAVAWLKLADFLPVNLAVARYSGSCSLKSTAQIARISECFEFDYYGAYEQVKFDGPDSA
jgi:hypothetical protein